MSSCFEGTPAILHGVATKDGTLDVINTNTVIVRSWGLIFCLTIALMIVCIYIYVYISMCIMTISMVLMIMIGTKAINNTNYRTTVRAFITINTDSNNKNDTSFCDNSALKEVVIKKSKPLPSNQMVPVSSKTKQSPRSPPQTDP